MNDQKVTAIAGSNIALIKYWGNREEALRLPMNHSISITLDTVYTVTTLEFREGLAADEAIINGEKAEGQPLQRVQHFLDQLRARFDFPHHAFLISKNNFPTAAGIASSASAFAALATAAVGAMGQSLTPEALSSLARLGSGSAARSVIGGFVELVTGDSHEEAYASQIVPPIHWEVVDLIAVVSTHEKAVKSSAGHRSAHSSPLYNARLVQVKNRLSPLRRAIQQRDFTVLGNITEQDALSMHAIMMTSEPSLLYWSPETLRVLQAVRVWREEGLDAYFTIDAGPNVHVLTHGNNTMEVKRRLEALDGVQTVMMCRPGQGARLSDNHLF